MPSKQNHPAYLAKKKMLPKTPVSQQGLKNLTIFLYLCQKLQEEKKEKESLALTSQTEYMALPT